MNCLIRLRTGTGSFRLGRIEEDALALLAQGKTTGVVYIYLQTMP